jgi:hypothetical protein
MNLKKMTVGAAFVTGLTLGGGGTGYVMTDHTPRVEMTAADAIRPAKLDLLTVKDRDSIDERGDVIPIYRTDTVEVPADRVYPTMDVRAFVAVGKSLTVTVDDGDTAIAWQLRPETPTYAIVKAQTMAGENKPTGKAGFKPEEVLNEKPE